MVRYYTERYYYSYNMSVDLHHWCWQARPSLHVTPTGRPRSSWVHSCSSGCTSEPRWPCTTATIDMYCTQMHKQMHTQMHTHTNAHTHKCTHKCTHTHHKYTTPHPTHTETPVHTQTCIPMHACMHSRIHACMHSLTHAHTHTHACTRTHTHTHKHLLKQKILKTHGETITFRLKSAVPRLRNLLQATRLKLQWEVSTKFIFPIHSPSAAQSRTWHSAGIPSLSPSWLWWPVRCQGSDHSNQCPCLSGNYGNRTNKTCQQ